MTRTVDELRNDVRLAVDRFERPPSTAFTKESLAAICAAVGDDVGDRFPPKAEMRGRILRGIDRLDDESAEVDRPFRKAELVAIAGALEEE